jgi:hypothetical protein
MRRPRLADRIDDALRGGRVTFYDLAMKLYPDRESHRCATHGGPPGCYVTLSMTLRRGGFLVLPQGPGPENRWVYPRRPT